MLREPAPPQRSAAVFLDRDGTLNLEVERVATPEDLVLIDGAAQAVARINRLGVRTILITNQAILARGLCDEAGLARIHAKLRDLLGQSGAWLDAIYYCPHLPDDGKGGIPELKIDCDCRKPRPGMILRAKEDFALDLEKSWMIGDSVKDIRLARAAGVRSILVKTGKAGSDASPSDPPDYTFDSLREAAAFLESVATSS